MTNYSDQLFDFNKNKNKIINGNFDIWQRGTSQTINYYGSVDRWLTTSTGTTHSVSRQSFTVGQTDVPGNPKYFYRSVVTSVAGASNFNVLVQRIEGVNTLSGNTCTLSFYAKANTSKNIAIDFQQYFGTGGSPSASVKGTGQQKFALTTSWQEFTATIDIPSISGKILGTDNNDRLEIRFWFDAGSSYDSVTDSLGQQSGTFDMSRIQIEKGSVATSFEARHIGEEVALCERYYEKSYNIDVQPGTNTTVGYAGQLFVSGANTTGILGNGTMFRTTKRGTPTITIFDLVGNSSRVSTHNQSGVPANNVTYTTLHGVGNNGFQIYKSSAGSICSIEYHYTASAEL